MVIRPRIPPPTSGGSTRTAPSRVRSRAYPVRSPRAVRKARAFTRRTLVRWGLDTFTDVAELLVSELVTNAQLHGNGVDLVTLSYGDILVCEVRDLRPDLPVRREPDPGADEYGRGLQLVAALADDWGAYRDGSDRGKTVWFSLTVPASEGDEP